jgi:NRAMP (natural resistance-associated macrophage protein)-like metal ion transporter
MHWKTRNHSSAHRRYSNPILAILLQYLSLKLGIVTGRDLAQACREYYPKKVALSLWLLCEIGIAATSSAWLPA